MTGLDTMQEVRAEMTKYERSAKAVGFARAIRDVVEMIRKDEHVLTIEKIVDLPNPYDNERG